MRVPGSNHWRMSPTGGIKRDARSKTFRDRYHGCVIASGFDDSRNSQAASSVQPGKEAAAERRGNNPAWRLFGVRWLDSAFLGGGLAPSLVVGRIKTVRPERS